MPSYSRLIFCVACFALLILACGAAGCSSSTAPSAPVSTQAPAGGGGTVTIKNFAFDPQVLTVKSGTVVTWVNQDTTPHTIVSDAGSPESFSSDTLKTDATYAFTFTQAGTYNYHCSIHPTMHGTIVVQS